MSSAVPVISTLRVKIEYFSKSIGKSDTVSESSGKSDKLLKAMVN